MEATPSVCMDPSVRFPSSWRVHFALGPLSGRKIAEYARAGRYGPQVKAVFTNAALRRKTISATLCDDCHQPGASYAWYDYLPKHGHYCHVCKKKYRALAAAAKMAEREKERRWKERLTNEYQ